MLSVSSLFEVLYVVEIGAKSEQPSGGWCFLWVGQYKLAHPIFDMALGCVGARGATRPIGGMEVGGAPDGLFIPRPKQATLFAVKPE